MINSKNSEFSSSLPATATAFKKSVDNNELGSDKSTAWNSSSIPLKNASK